MVRVLSTNNNGSLRVRFKLDGKIYNISGLGKSNNRLACAKAELIAATIERDIEVCSFDPTLVKYLPQESVTVPKPEKLIELWDAWISTLHLSKQTKSEHYQNTRNMILRAKPTPSSDSGEWFIKDGAHLSAFSFNLRKRFISNCLDWAIGQKLVTVNPFRTIKSKKAPKHNKTAPLSIEQVRQIIEGFKLYYPDYVEFSTFLFLTGCRLSEAAAIQWKRIDFDRREVTIADTLAKVNYQKDRIRQQTKTGSITILAMSEGLLKLLESQHKANSDDLVFTYPSGEAISPEKYYKAWVRLLKKLGIPHVKAYSSRHTFTSHALDSGLDASTVGRFLGHTDGSMVDRNYGSTITTPRLPELNL